MLALTVYCKDRRRRPVRFGHTPFFRDVQADIPAGWCCRCGSEVFESGKDLCMGCHSLKGENG